MEGYIEAREIELEVLAEKVESDTAIFEKENEERDKLSIKLSKEKNSRN